mgnify:CR=1 FL=1
MSYTLEVLSGYPVRVSPANGPAPAQGRKFFEDAHAAFYLLPTEEARQKALILEDPRQSWAVCEIDLMLGGFIQRSPFLGLWVAVLDRLPTGFATVAIIRRAEAPAEADPPSFPAILLDPNAPGVAEAIQALCRNPIPPDFIAEHTRPCRS